MRVNALVDTGAILALLDRSDRWHRLCVETFSSLHLPLLTSEAVLTEVFHLVGEERHETEAAWKFVRSGALELAVVSHSELPAVHALMSRYWTDPWILPAQRSFISPNASRSPRCSPSTAPISKPTESMPAAASASCPQPGLNREPVPSNATSPSQLEQRGSDQPHRFGTYSSMHGRKLGLTSTSTLQSE